MLRRVKSVRTLRRTTFTRTRRIPYYFVKDGCYSLNSGFSLLEAMGKNKMKTEDIKIHGRSHENDSRPLETAASKRSIAEDFAVPETTLRKRLKTESTDFSGSLPGYFFK